jgi:hypothetical protein
MFRTLFVCTTFAVIMSVGLPRSAEATEWFVAPGGTGSGTSAAPFGKIQDGLNKALPGDTVTVAAGTYAELIRSVRNGSGTARIVLRAAGARGSVIVTMPGRVLTVGHSYLTINSLVLDGQYGADDTVRVGSAGSYLTLQNVEIRRSSRDLIDMIAPQGVLIEGSLLHHALNAAGGRTDAHGIVAGAVRDLTVRNTEIHTFSGDGVQLDPSRSLPGWDRVTIEGCRIWLAPLPAAVNGFAAGTVTGENAVDTKAAATVARATIVIRDTIAYGFRHGLLANMAAFNLKENVNATVDRVTAYNSEIAFRLRGGGTTGNPGALVGIQNTVVYDVDYGFRYEDGITGTRIWNTTLGTAVLRAFRAVSASSSGLDVRNLLVLGTTKPAEAGDPSNMLVAADAFVNATTHNYGLVVGSRAIDTGATIAGVSVDRIGTKRPQGLAYDVGAYEWLAPQASASDIVIYGRSASVISGAWRLVQDSAAAGGLRITHPDALEPRLYTPLAQPVNYFEITTTVVAGQPYRLWLRGKADLDSRKNDAVYLQFSGAVDVAGNPIDRIGTTSGELVEIEECVGCGLRNWGWQDNGMGVGVLGRLLYFAQTGVQTIRIQTAQDGLSIDQIVLSPSTYLTGAPGAVRKDTTILPES